MCNVWLLLADLWRVSRMGNETRVHTGTERFETHWAQRLQCAHHVHHGRRDCARVVRPTGRRVHSHFSFHHFLHHGDTVFGVCAKSKTRGIDTPLF